MAGLSYFKRALGPSLYRRNTGILSARASGFLNVRVFSSVEDVETSNGLNQDERNLHKFRCLLNEYGFTPEQVAKISKCSSFSRNVERLSPKLAFLRSIVGSNDDVARFAAANPRVLAYSLKNRLIPNYNFIKSILHRDELVAKCIARSSYVLCMELENNLAPKVSLLRDHGMPSSSITKMMEYCPGIFCLSFSKLEGCLKKAMTFGFEPSNPMIVPAIRAIFQINESVWDRKLELYRKWGWSNDEFLLAFKKQPFVMCLSEEKINKGMDVFTSIFGLSSSDIVKYPTLLFFSVEKRIIPRCSVVALLFSKGVLGDMSPKIATYAWAIWKREEAFVERFVDRYPEHDVLELWQKLRWKAVV